MAIVLVCGGRDFNDPAFVNRHLTGLHVRRGISLIIEGGANGADRLARAWARGHDIKVRTFPADWDAHGRSAGPIRNRQMLVEGKPDLVLAFPGGRGTANMISQARAVGVEVLEVKI